MPRPSPVRLNVLSDLHLSRGGLAYPTASADIIILAGDIARPEQAMQWALGLSKPVIYVAGNHESYGSSISRTMSDLKQRCAGTHVHVLDKEEVVMQGVRFLGATLWSGFMLAGPGEPRDHAMAQAQEFIRDFTRIESDHVPGRAFSPLESVDIFNEHCSWLEHKLAEPFDGPTVVITHHAPSTRSIHPRFAGSAVNDCFVSDVEYLMDGTRAGLWIHGHTHDSFDYRVNGTRVVCNPRGYVADDVNENSRFDPDLVIAAT